MLVMGIDPGLSRCGYGVIRQKGRATEAVAAGIIRTDKDDPIARRLYELQNELADLMGEYNPDAVAIEQVLFQVNVRTAMGVGQASGVAMAAGVGAGAGPRLPSRLAARISWARARTCSCCASVSPICASPQTRRGRISPLNNERSPVCWARATSRAGRLACSSAALIASSSAAEPRSERLSSTFGTK